jgi:hypothetical protein
MHAHDTPDNSVTATQRHGRSKGTTTAAAALVATAALVLARPAEARYTLTSTGQFLDRAYTVEDDQVGIMFDIGAETRLAPRHVRDGGRYVSGDLRIAWWNDSDKSTQICGTEFPKDFDFYLDYERGVHSFICYDDKKHKYFGEDTESKKDKWNEVTDGFKDVFDAENKNVLGQEVVLRASRHPMHPIASDVTIGVKAQPTQWATLCGGTLALSADIGYSSIIDWVAQRNLHGGGLSLGGDWNWRRDQFGASVHLDGGAAVYDVPGIPAAWVGRLRPSVGVAWDLMEPGIFNLNISTPMTFYAGDDSLENQLHSFGVVGEIFFEIKVIALRTKIGIHLNGGYFTRWRESSPRYGLVGAAMSFSGFPFWEGSENIRDWRGLGMCTLTEKDGRQVHIHGLRPGDDACTTLQSEQGLASTPSGAPAAPPIPE